MRKWKKSLSPADPGSIHAYRLEHRVHSAPGRIQPTLPLEVSKRLRKVPGLDTRLLGLFTDLTDRHLGLLGNDFAELIRDGRTATCAPGSPRPPTPHGSAQFEDLPVQGRQLLAVLRDEFLALRLQLFALLGESLLLACRLFFLALPRQSVYLSGAHILNILFCFTYDCSIFYDGMKHFGFHWTQVVPQVSLRPLRMSASVMILGKIEPD